MPGIHIAIADWAHYAQLYLWPFVRVGALLMAAPVFSSQLISPRVRLLIAALMAWLLMPLLPPTTGLPMLSAAWFLALGHELLIGVLLGFVLQLVFEALMFAGELMSLGMGLGFAQLADPLRGGSSPIISQFFLLLATTLFVVSDGHLAMLDMIARSFKAVPVASGHFGLGDIWTVVEFGGRMLAAGIRLALPVVVALLLVNLAFGIISRATPALNLFALGFPITLLAGLLLMRWVVPLVADQLSQDSHSAFSLARQLLGAGG